ncbi:MAG: amino acid ABC transporter substrate-binding protein, partial [Psychrobacter sp.]|nr:amino acid ABC transporter substrate-binding protein [Psychrobacter sp.]
GSSDLLQRINNGDTIIVGTEGTYPPFTYHNESGKLTGYDVEVTRAVADKLGVEVDFKETQWDAMLAGLDSKRFDMVANQVSLTTPERQKKYDIATPYSWSGAVVLAPTDDNRYSSWEGLKGLRTAQSLSSNYGELAERYEAEIVPVDGMAQAVQLVKQDRADFTMNDRLAVLDYLKKFPDANLEIKLTAPKSEQRGSGLILIKGDDAVVEKLNDAMATLQADGTLTELSEEFFGADISQQK